MLRNSIRQLFRTPVKTIIFILLILAAGMLLSLGGSLWVINNRNIKLYEKSFVTIGTVEQRATSIAQRERWNPIEKEYVIIQRPVYGEILPLSVLDFKGAGYIKKPEKRPYYASYGLEYILDKRTSRLSVIEITPLEDGIPNQPVSAEISRVLYGDRVKIGQTIKLYDETLVNPKPLYKGITYILCVFEIPVRDGNNWKVEYSPCSIITSIQYHPNGKRVPDALKEDSLYYEVTEDFYNTKIGKRFIEYVKSAEQYVHSLPVTGTNATILLMPFYNKDAYICQGRDIINDEYEKGAKVCLIPKKFAENNNLDVGDTIHLRLYYVDYRSTAAEYFDTSSNAQLNAKGEAYRVFEESDYTIVGIYNVSPGAVKGSYGLAINELIIPSKSIENTDKNNILNYGPMKGSTTSFQLPNGSVEEFTKKWAKLGYDQLEINFYDRGYSKLKAGMDNMRNMALTLMAVGFVMVIFVLLFFSHIFITKQRRRTAIERSLGMKKRKCMLSLLIGILFVLILGSALGSSTGGAISLWLSRINVSNSYYNTMYSGGMADAETLENVKFHNGDEPMIILISVLSMSLILLLGIGISVYQINRNLKYEPMELLSRKKE